jgi:hypothetical protein
MAIALSLSLNQLADTGESGRKKNCATRYHVEVIDGKGQPTRITPVTQLNNAMKRNINRQLDCSEMSDASK